MEVFFVFSEKIAIFARQFHIMSVNLSKQTADLRTLIGQLKQRCLDAEARVADMQVELGQKQERIDQLQADMDTLATKYRHLQSGLAATGSDPEGIERLKAQYLAMVSELDACIAMLQHG